MKEPIILTGKYHKDNLQIYINKKNIKFVASVDGTGDSFIIEKEILRDLLK